MALAAERFGATLALPASATLADFGEHLFQVSGTCFVTVIRGSVLVGGRLLKASAPQVSLLVQAPPGAAPVYIFPVIEKRGVECYSSEGLLPRHGIPVPAGAADAGAGAVVAIEFDVSAAGARVTRPEPLKTAVSWVRTAFSVLKHGRVLVNGPRDSGKSSFLRLAAALAVSAGMRAAVVDTDPGQPEFGPPGFVSAVPLAPFNPSPPGARPVAPRPPEARLFFVGCLTPRDLPAAYLDAIDAAVGAACDGYDVVLANTHGWTRGFGTETVRRVVRSLDPGVVVELGSARSSFEAATNAPEDRRLSAIKLSNAQTLRRLDAFPGGRKNAAQVRAGVTLQHLLPERARAAENTLVVENLTRAFLVAAGLRASAEALAQLAQDAEAARQLRSLLGARLEACTRPPPTVFKAPPQRIPASRVRIENWAHERRVLWQGARWGESAPVGSEEFRDILRAVDQMLVAVAVEERSEAPQRTFGADRSVGAWELREGPQFAAAVPCPERFAHLRFLGLALVRGCHTRAFELVSAARASAAARLVLALSPAGMLPVPRHLVPEPGAGATHVGFTGAVAGSAHMLRRGELRR